MNNPPTPEDAKRQYEAAQRLAGLTPAEEATPAVIGQIAPMEPESTPIGLAHREATEENPALVAMSFGGKRITHLALPPRSAEKLGYEMIRRAYLAAGEPKARYTDTVHRLRVGVLGLDAILEELEKHTTDAVQLNAIKTGRRIAAEAVGCPVDEEGGA